MKDLKLRTDLYTGFGWAIFTLGASHLAVVLGGPMFFFITVFSCASILAFFLMKTLDPRNRSLKQIARPYLISAGILIITNVLYGYLVFLKPDDVSYLVFLIFETFLFLIPLLITIPFLRKSSNVTE